MTIQACKPSDPMYTRKSPFQWTDTRIVCMRISFSVFFYSSDAFQLHPKDISHLSQVWRWNQSGSTGEEDRVNFSRGFVKCFRFIRSPKGRKTKISSDRMVYCHLSCLGVNRDIEWVQVKVCNWLLWPMCILQEL